MPAPLANAPLANMPRTEEELILHVLSNTKHQSLVGALRVVYVWTTGGNGVEKRMAIWIRNNWNWVVKKHEFVYLDDREMLEIEFNFTGIVLGNHWTVQSDSLILPEQKLYAFVKEIDNAP
jgi:hypothetical protein